jgi:predicted 2-oxoglutarate/Fe(II)-dependent dioxygenase YbiX
VQSHVRDGSAREILRDLARATQALQASTDAGAALDLVNKAHTNLLRRWSEP